MVPVRIVFSGGALDDLAYLAALWRCKDLGETLHRCGSIGKALQRQRDEGFTEIIVRDPLTGRERTLDVTFLA